MRKNGRVQSRICKPSVRRRSPNDIEIEVAIRAVNGILRGDETEYDLVTSDVFRKAHGKFRSEAYVHYDFLCLRNTRTCVGWVLCKFAKVKRCEVPTGLRRFDPRAGTTSLLNHTDTHEVATNKLDGLVKTKLSMTDKQSLIPKAVDVAVHGLLPLSFSYNRPGMAAFAAQLIKIGQNLPPSVNVDVLDLLPSSQAVSNGLHEKAAQTRAALATSLIPKVMRLGGGVSCDGLKQPLTGKKFYDFVLHYVEVNRHMLTGGLDVSLQSRVLLLVEHNDSESAELIKKNLDRALTVRFGIGLSQFMEKFTLVTDWAATLPNIVGASASSSRVPFGWRWLGCIVHKLNTTLKTVVESERAAGSRVHQDLESVKALVRIFKAGGWNNGLPDGCALYQECETRFGTTFEVVQRFLKAAPHVAIMVGTKNHAGATTALDAIEKNTDTETGTVSYPALQAIIDVFRGVRHMQNAMEAASYPMLHLVIPMLRDITSELTLITRGVAMGAKFEVPSSHKITLAGKLLSVLRSIEVHGAWAAACVLHPGMRTFEKFVSSESERDQLRRKGCSFVRQLLSTSSHVAESGAAANGSGNSEVSQGQIVPNPLGTASVHTINYMALSGQSSSQDELARYLSLPVSEDCINSLASDNLQIFRYWASCSQSFPKLSNIALHVLAIPPSSCASERDFSEVNRIVTPQRNRLNSDTIEDIVFLRSFGRITAEETDVAM